MPSFLLFLLNPLIGYYNALRNLSGRGSLLVIVCFFAVWAYHVPFERTDNVDYVRHARFFEEFGGADQQKYLDEIKSLLFDFNYKNDVYRQVLVLIMRPLTDDYRAYFAVVAAIMGVLFYYILLSFGLLNKGSGLEWALYWLIVIIIFNPYRMASYRQFTANMVFVLLAFRHFESRDWKYLVLNGLCVLIHFSYLSVLPLIVFQFAAGNRWSWYYLLIAGCFVISSILPDFLQSYTEDSTEGVLRITKGYTSDSYIERSAEKSGATNPIVLYQIYFSSIALFVVGVLLQAKQYIISNRATWLYALSLIFFAIVVLVNTNMTAITRFGTMHIAFSFFLYIQLLTEGRPFPLLARLGIGAIAVGNLPIFIRKTIEYMPEQSLLGFLPITFFIDKPLSVLDYIK